MTEYKRSRPKFLHYPNTPETVEKYLAHIIDFAELLERHTSVGCCKLDDHPKYLRDMVHFARKVWDLMPQKINVGSIITQKVYQSVKYANMDRDELLAKFKGYFYSYEETKMNEIMEPTTPEPLELDPTELENKEESGITMRCRDKEMLKLCGNGDIFVKGVLCANNIEIVDAAYEFFTLARHEATHCPKCNWVLVKTEDMQEIENERV